MIITKTCFRSWQNKIQLGSIVNYAFYPLYFFFFFTWKLKFYKINQFIFCFLLVNIFLVIYLQKSIEILHTSATTYYFQILNIVIKLKLVLFVFFSSSIARQYIIISHLVILLLFSIMLCLYYELQFYFYNLTYFIQCFINFINILVPIFYIKVSKMRFFKVALVHNYTLLYSSY